MIKRLQMGTCMSNEYNDDKTWELFLEGKTKYTYTEFYAILQDQNGIWKTEEEE